MAAENFPQQTTGAAPALGSARERAAYLLPLLLAAFVAAHAAAGAISITTNEPAYELVLHLLLTLAMICSYLGVRIGRSFAALGAVVMLVAFATYGLRFDQAMPFMPLIYPMEVLGDDEVSLAALCAWFLVGFCFMQNQRENLVFVFVPGLAVFGLMATRNLNPELLVSFMVFMSASVYCWGYDHFLRAAETAGRRLDWRHWARAHVSGAALVFVLAALGGLLVGNALYYATPRMYTGFGLQQRIWNYAGAHVQGYFLFRDGFEIGAGPIRLSQEPVLKVKADELHLWRGRVYDFYDGEGWERSDRSQLRVVKTEDDTFLLRTLVKPRGPAGVSEPIVDQATGQSGPAPEPGGPIPMAPMPGPPPMAGGPHQAPGAPGPSPGVGPFGPGSGGPPMMPPTPAAPPIPPPTWTLAPLKGREFKQVFEVVGSSTVGLFGASFPERLKFGPPMGPVSPARRGGVATDSTGSIQTTSVMNVGQTYTVWSRIPDFTPDQLRAARRERYPREFRQRYIEQNSAEVATELSPLVKSITRGLTNDFDKARAIQDYLEKRCLYTLDVPFTPVGRDRVVYFVKSSRRGACDLFSSAMALMCRLAGIPARVATGFNRGEWSAQDQAIIVRGSDAHAWVEVYFGELGWVPFDLVAERTLETSSWASLLEMGQWRLAARRFLRVLLGGLVVAACIYLAATALVDPRTYLASAMGRWRRRRNPLALLAFEYEGLLRGIARRGHIRHWRPLTPLELIASVTQGTKWRSSPDLMAELERLTQNFYRLRYSSRRTSGQLLELRKDIRRLARALKRAHLSR
ncbi:MAG: transglutaminase domain-containing protein [Armatimonadetes bacterium]|nr:transglutaminase domain-containing protein [Armatimonadota bacterium]